MPGRDHEVQLKSTAQSRAFAQTDAWKRRAL